MSENKFMKKYDVLYYDSDVNENIRMVPLMKIFGDVSAIHEEELAYEGIKYLKDHELSWIIYSYSIDIKKPIPYKSSINVETYLEGIKKFYACRVYKVYNEKNELVAEGKIIFLLIDLEKRRAVRIPKEYCELINMNDTGEVELKSTKVEKLIREDLESNIYVRRSDIDFNKHVNNTKYLEWTMEATPECILDEYSLISAKIKYEKEVRLGDDVNIICQWDEIEEGYKCLYKIVNNRLGEVSASIETIWKKEF